MKQNKYDDPGFAPPQEVIARDPAMADEARWPVFQRIAARKPGQPQSAGSGGWTRLPS